MRLRNLGELSLLREVRARFGTRGKGLITGIGDDAAVIAPPKESLLLTSDMMVEDVHFDLSYITPFQLGFKLISVNVSDIYAMSGRPLYVILDLAMTGNTDKGFVDAFFRGVDRALKRYGLILIGGDLSSSKKGLVIAATVIGRVTKPVLRSGARPGDRIYVTGNLGDSACGLEILQRIKRYIPFEDLKILRKDLKDIKERLSRIGLKWNIVKNLMNKHLFSEVSPLRCREATSMMDISDGLFIDLARLCEESRVGARVYLKKIPLSNALKRACSILNLDPYLIATTGGEDYELLFTAPPEKRIKAFCIGEIIKEGMYLVDENGLERPLLSGGYQHWH